MKSRSLTKHYYINRKQRKISLEQRKDSKCQEIASCRNF